MLNCSSHTVSIGQLIRDNGESNFIAIALIIAVAGDIRHFKDKTPRSYFTKFKYFQYKR